MKEPRSIKFEDLPEGLFGFSTLEGSLEKGLERDLENRKMDYEFSGISAPFMPVEDDSYELMNSSLDDRMNLGFNYIGRAHR